LTCQEFSQDFSGEFPNAFDDLGKRCSPTSVLRLAFVLESRHFFHERRELEMNETLSLLTTRRSIPAVSLASPGPNAEELDLLLTIASRVPDHGKLVPWRFIVFEGAGRERAGEIIADVYAKANPQADAARLDTERKRLALAPLVVAVVSRAGEHQKIPEWEQILTAGAVCMNLTLAATALGFGSVWLSEWYAYDRAVLDRLGLASHERLAGFIHIGRSPGPREDRPRPALSDIVTRFAE
jgi:nitroreductase